MLNTENGKMTRQEYKQWYLYIFKMMEKPEVVIGHHLRYIVIVTDLYSRINLKSVLL